MNINDLIRQQYDYAPYPYSPINQAPKQKLYELFINDITTPYYLRNCRPIHTETTILDVGCGSGFKTLQLAQANPTAQIIGIDFSPNSIETARQRLEALPFGNVRFEVLSIDNLSSLNLQFDHINCDEVLYLLTDPVAALRQLLSVLKPEGTIRANLHSQFQRQAYFRSQEFLKIIGLMDASGKREVLMTARLLETIKDNVELKRETVPKLQGTVSAEFIAEIPMNFLLQNDKGFTIPDMFAMLEAAELEFVSMVHTTQWNYLELFKRPPEQIAVFGLHPDKLSIQQQLHIFELLHPIHRLLDFWCGHPKNAQASSQSFSENPDTRLQLHPQLQRAKIKETFLNCLKTQQPLNVQTLLEIPSLDISSKTAYWIERHEMACLLPLCDGPQPISVLAERWARLHPVDPVTLEPVSAATSQVAVRQMIAKLEELACVLVG